MSEQGRASTPGAGDAPGSSGSAEPSDRAARPVPEATVSRFSLYLEVLAGLRRDAVATVSSEQLAVLAGVGSAKLRKDLSFLGSPGTRGVGYDVVRLHARLEQTLGLTRRHHVALVGAGNLGRALVGYEGFGSRGFTVAALFDVDPELVGTAVAGLQVHPVDRLGAECRTHGITIGVLAVPPTAAQAVADLLVAAGVRCILTFAPAVVRVPDTVDVRRVDLAAELQVLSFHVARREAQLDGAAPAAAALPPARPGPVRTPAPGRPRASRTTARRNGPVIVP